MLVYFTTLLVTIYLFGRGDIVGRDDVLKKFQLDISETLEELVNKYGYPLDLYHVTTEDNYILGLHRIKHGKNNANSAVKKPVVLLQSGLWCDSSIWVIMGPTSGLAYLLADQGYDVWLGNTRGTTYSRNHTTLDPDSAKTFWKFSFNEMGVYDLPAMIDFILNETNTDQLNYFGHSQGSMILLIMGSEKPEYNSKIKFATLFAPVTTMKNSQNPYLGFFSSHLNLIEITMNLKGMYEVLPHQQWITDTSNVFCNDDSPTQDLCMELFFMFAGPDPDQFNKTMVPLITSYIPAGASSQQLFHFFQIHLSKVFQKYDFGERKNMKIYGQRIPPEYDVTKITAPILLYSATNDWMADHRDVFDLYKILKNPVGFFNITGYNHLDYTWANNVVSVIYNDLIQFVNKINF